MSTFLEEMSEVAGADILSGEDLYGWLFDLIETFAKNQQFEKFGSYNMLMLTNSGSYFVI